MDVRNLIGGMLATSALVNVSEAVNVGREEGFADIADQLGAFQWSAILDKATCPRCRKLDGTYFRAGDPLLIAIRPPLHPACRCILVGVLTEEVSSREKGTFPIKFQGFTEQDILNFLRNKIT